MSVCREKLLNDAQFSQEWSKASTSYSHTQPFRPATDAERWNPQGRQFPHGQRQEGTCGCLRRAFNRLRCVLASCLETVQGDRHRFARTSMSNESQSTSDESLEHAKRIFATASSEMMRAYAEDDSGNHAVRADTGDCGRTYTGQHVSGLRRRKRIWSDLNTHGSAHSVRGDDDINNFVDEVGEFKGRISVQFGFKTNVVAIQTDSSSMDLFIVDENSSVIETMTDSATPSESSASDDSWEIIEEADVSDKECGADVQYPVTINIDGSDLVGNDDRCGADLVEDDFEIINNTDALEQLTDDEGDIVVLPHTFQ